MNNLKMNTSPSTVTRDVRQLDKDTANIYESLVIISKRANQNSVTLKEELNSKLAECASTSDNLEEVFENREQIEPSKFDVRLPKPTLIATQEFLEGKIYLMN